MQRRFLGVVAGCALLAVTLCSCPRSNPGAGGQLTDEERAIANNAAYATTLLSQTGALLEPVLAEVAPGGVLSPLVAANIETALGDAFHATSGVRAAAVAGGVLVEFDGLTVSPAGLRIDGAMTLAESGSPLGLDVEFGALQVANGTVSGTLRLDPSGVQWVASAAEPLVLSWDVPARAITVGMDGLSWSFAGGGSRTIAGNLALESAEATAAAATTVVLTAIAQDSFGPFPQSGSIAVPMDGFTATLTFTGEDQADLTSGDDWTIGIALPDDIRHYTLGRHAGGATAAAVSGDGGSVLSGGVDGTLKCWDASTMALEGRVVGHSGGVTACAWCEDDAFAVSSGADGALRTWNGATWTQAAELAVGSPATALAFSPGDPTLLAGALADGSVRLWTVSETGAIAAAATLTDGASAHAGGANAVAFSETGAVLATAGADSTIRLWSLSGGAASATLLGALAGHASSVTGVGFLADGSLASTDSSGTVRLWDPTTRTALGVAATAPTAWAVTGYGCLTVATGSGTAATGASDNGGIVWWTRKGSAGMQTKTRCAIFGDDVVDLASAPDGRAVASASRDGTVKLVTTGTIYVP